MLSLAPNKDTVAFQRKILHRDLWEQQKRICSAIETHRLVSVKACHASGKTFNAAGIALDFVTRHKAGKVLWIAPTLRQVKLGIDEIALAAQRSAIRFPEPSTTGLRLNQENYIQGFSAGKGINAQGFHGAKVLIIADEAPGIAGDVWEAIEGIRAGGDVRILKLGNPTVPSGPFFEDFNKGKNVVHGITINAFDTPNLQGVSIEQLVEMGEEDLSAAQYPFLVSRRWVKEAYFKWGPNHPSYQSRVLGNFPSQGQFSVFSADVVQQSSRPVTEEQWAELRQWNEIIQVGIDVAGAGDDETAACARAGNVVIKQGAWVDADARGPVALFLSRLRRDYPHARIVVMVDITGVGYHFGTWLADQAYEVHGFIAGGKAMDQTSFANAKAEAYWCAGEWMKRGIYGVEDLDTQGQLIGVQYKPLATGGIMIERKEDAKKRGMSSPDRAEALIMSFVPIVPRDQVVTSGQLMPPVQISPY